MAWLKQCLSLMLKEKLIERCISQWLLFCNFGQFNIVNCVLKNLKEPGSGAVFWIRIQHAIRYGSNTDLEPKHCSHLHLLLFSDKKLLIYLYGTGTGIYSNCDFCDCQNHKIVSVPSFTRNIFVKAIIIIDSPPRCPTRTAFTSATSAA